MRRVGNPNNPSVDLMLAQCKDDHLGLEESSGAYRRPVLLSFNGDSTRGSNDSFHALSRPGHWLLSFY